MRVSGRIPKRGAPGRAGSPAAPGPPVVCQPRPGLSTNHFGYGLLADEKFLLADDFDYHSLFSLPVEFGIKHALPWPQVEVAVCDGQNHLMAQQQALEVRVPVALARVVVMVVGAERGEFLGPFHDVGNQPALLVIYIDGGSYVHGRHEAEALAHA